MRSDAQTVTVAPTTKLVVTLEAQAWNGVMEALSKAPYCVAAPLIQMIGEQLQEQAQAVAARRGNGLDEHPETLA